MLLRDSLSKRGISYIEVGLSTAPDCCPFRLFVALGVTLTMQNAQDSGGASIGRRYARNDELGTPIGMLLPAQLISSTGPKINTLDL